MRKFSCVHCGHRLAVQPRHLGRLVTCPECGRATHPLADQILGNSATESTSKTASPAKQTSCANCGVNLGKLQQQRILDGHIICLACHAALSAESGQSISRNSKASDDRAVL